MIDILLYLFAALGVILLLLIIWMMLDEWRNPASLPGLPPNAVTPNSPKDDALEYLDNEVRGRMRYENTFTRGRVALKEPTLKGRVDMIEKHLGITIEVKPAKDAQLVIKKGIR